MLENYKIIKPLLTPVLFTLIIYSCGNKPEPKPRIFEGYAVWMDTVMLSPEKIIRSVEPGMSYAEVSVIEPLKPVEGDSLCQYYEFKTDSNYTVTFSYRFENKNLDEIEMTIFTNEIEAGNNVFNQLKKYYESRFSTPVFEKGIYVFTATTTSGNPAKISLEDRSEVQNGVVHLLIYSEK